MFPHDIDLGDLNILRLVHQHKSFTAAAKELGQTQSTVSYRIEKLRRSFGDPLFVRVGGRLSVTTRCEEIVEFASKTLIGIDSLLAGTDFDPSTASDTMCISCNYYHRALILPKVFQLVRRKAPNLVLKIITASNKGHEHLKKGTADLLISPVDSGGEGFFKRRLLGDVYVCVMHKSNSLCGQEIDMRAYLNASHVTVNYGDGWVSGYQADLSELGHQTKTVCTVPSPADLLHVVPETDMISTIPYRLAKILPPEFVVQACPVPAPFDINLYWTERTHHVPAIGWMRNLIVEAAAHCETLGVPPKTPQNPN